MARITGFINAELRGKLGGTVYARNGAGAYVRSYVTPVDPKTAAQVGARNSFAGASGTYHALSSPVKALWGNFAINQFNPKQGVNNGQFSGFNAFTALRNLVQNALRLPSEPTVTVNGSAPGTPATFNPYAAQTSPPINALQPALKEQTTGNALNLGIQSVAVDDAGGFDITLSVAGAPVGGSDIEDFIDPNDNAMGFVVYMSNPVEQNKMFFQNPYKYCLGYVKQISLDSADRSGVETIELSESGVVTPSDYKQFPQEDEIVRISVFASSLDGMLARIGTRDVAIDAA